MKRNFITTSFRILLLAPVLGLGLFITGCATVQDTGRKQLLLTSADEEAKMGIQSFDQIKKEEKISTNAATNARIQKIGKRIAAAVGRDLPNAQWEFVVFDSPTVNAFALPGGKVGVYTGLIKLASSDDEIATVMGHEIAHVSCRHGGERMSQQMVAQLGGVALALGTQNSQYQALYAQAYDTGSQLAIMLPYSRKHETEADEVGLRYAANAGYDPRAAVTFWQKMAAQSAGQEPLPILSTHPSNADRISNLQRLAPSLMPTYEAARARLGN
ncbi:M48 family metalloprotease [Geminisphaera colitermitum]|uniref:M48 family metalloprotease n=1 Tax=Geminisphaera colitermitum TaxID=1148786 RepID=UPI000158CF8B|nr:M48 family metalloprotease [Geminisphaera colitermitum]